MMSSSDKVVPAPRPSTDGSDDFDFQVTVEEQGASPLFVLPPQWTTEDRQLHNLSVTIIAPSPNSQAASKAHGIPLVTFHDVALSASTCFAPFFTYCQASGACPEVYAASAHYHITAPGCMPDAPTLPSDLPHQTIPDLAQSVVAALAELGVQRAVGFGAGIGSNVIFEAARAAPRLWAGLVLVSPSFYASSYVERAINISDGLYVMGLGLAGRVKEKFLQRWLAPATLEANSELAGTLESSIDRLNPANVARYMQADAWRDGMVPHLRELNLKIMLVSGRESYSRAGCEECFSQFDPTKTSWLDVPSVGGLAHAEDPDRVAQGLTLFLRGFGPYEPKQGLGDMYN